MAVTPDKVQIGTSQDYLDGVAVDTAAGTGLFRETVVLADPEAGGGLANVRDLGTQLLMTDKGVVTNTIIHGKTAQGNIVDIKANPSGALAVDATGSAVTVGNFPATQAVSGTVNVGNFPATQAISGTVTANLGTLNGAATSANQTTGNNSLASLDGKLPDESGTWGYNAGTTGTLSVAANKRILAISATSPSLTGGSMTINGGQTITIPAGTSITITPRANLVAPTVVFTGTASYFVEFIE